MRSLTLSAPSTDSFAAPDQSVTSPSSCIEAFLMRDAEKLVAETSIAPEVHHAQSMLGLPGIFDAEDNGEDQIVMLSAPRNLDALWGKMLPSYSPTQIAAYVTEHADEADLRLFALTDMPQLQMAVAEHHLLARKSAMAVLAQTRHTEVWEAVARNEALNPSTIARIWELAVIVKRAKDVDLYIASNMKTPQRIVDEIIQAHAAVDPTFAFQAKLMITELRRRNQLLRSFGRSGV